MTDAELIREVAEKVMGWQITPGGFWVKEGRSTLPIHSRDSFGEEELCQEAFNLTNLNHAFLVVEKMIEEGFSFASYKTALLSSVSTGWIAMFSKNVYPPPVPPNQDKYDGEIYWGHHQNLGHAICLAALKTEDK